MPRNASQQEKDIIGKTVSLSGSGGQKQRESILLKQSPGSCIYMPGHAMLYLGKDQWSTPTVVHSYGSHYSSSREVRVFKNAITHTRINTRSGNSFLESSRIIKDFINLD